MSLPNFSSLPHADMIGDIRYKNIYRGCEAAGRYFNLITFDPNFRLCGRSGFAAGFNRTMKRYQQMQQARV